jgi:hypothetical protein
MDSAAFSQKDSLLIGVRRRRRLPPVKKSSKPRPKLLNGNMLTNAKVRARLSALYYIASLFHAD